MEDRPFVPVVFLANVDQDKKYRHTPPAGERAVLERLEDSLTDSGSLEVARVDPENGVFFWDLFRKYKYDRSVSVLHLTGNERGSRQGLKVQTGLGVENLDLRQLAQQLAALPGLQLVILSGCAHAQLMETLLGLDIPAIWVTDELESTPLTFDILDQFYHAIGQQNTVREAFDRARTLFPYKYQYRETHYDLHTDHFVWQDQALGLIPWGMYYLTENASRLNWRIPTLPARKIDPQPVARPAPPVDPAPPARQAQDELLPLSMLKWALAAMLFIVSAILGMDAAEWMIPKEYGIEETAPVQDRKFRMRMFPIAQYADCKKTNPAYTRIMAKNLAQLALQDSQYISFSLVNTEACPEAEAWIRTEKADMVFWGNYTGQEDQVSVWLNAEYGRKRDSQRPTEKLTIEMSGDPEWFSGDSDAAFRHIRDLVYLAMGTYMYDRREYDLCLEYLGRIPLSEDTAYIRVDRLMARAYMAVNKYERAARRYEHILSIQPGNADAYLERGEMFARIGKYEDAMMNYERAIYFEPAMKPAYRGRAALHMHTRDYDAAIMDVKEMAQLDPDDPLAYGMLANLYALQDNKSLFFHYMEIALRKGYTPKEFLESPACKKYRGSKAFQILIETYKR